MGKIKKFKDTKVGNFLIGQKGLLNALANNLADSGVLGVVKDLIIDDKQITPADKERALKLLEMDSIELQEVSKRWQSDMTSDSWLSKNVRPLTLIFFSLAYVVGWFLEYSLADISNVLSIIIAAYFGSRGVEKYTKIKNK
ncbi:MAG: hypothetical protein Unbinned92contig1002_32 [Prokaryotic dsDNA virus sp.]|nr:MAG: hypothetical protein Unbinned92contig1002_32 [Prokaryotic dsDNA virus sp.]|tara:strand:- start:2634 stop:3056 length:423 start_codon:yes stop_codon:yes gene_type:complete